MCRVQVYIKQCTTCARPFQDCHNRNEVHVIKLPCPYVHTNRLSLGGCGQRTRQERCGRMDWRECEQCIDEAWLAYGEDRRWGSDEEGDEGGGRGGGPDYGMGGRGGDDVPRGFGGGAAGREGRGGQGEGGGSGQGRDDGKGKQPIRNSS